MKKKVIDINTKWNMLYKNYKLAKTKNKKDKLRKELFELLQYNALINQFNYDNRK